MARKYTTFAIAYGELGQSISDMRVFIIGKQNV